MWKKDLFVRKHHIKQEIILNGKKCDFFIPKAPLTKRRLLFSIMGITSSMLWQKCPVTFCFCFHKHPISKIIVYLIINWVFEDPKPRSHINLKQIYATMHFCWDTLKALTSLKYLYFIKPMLNNNFLYVMINNYQLNVLLYCNTNICMIWPGYNFIIWISQIDKYCVLFYFFQITIKLKATVRRGYYKMEIGITSITSYF